MAAEEPELRFGVYIGKRLRVETEGGCWMNGRLAAIMDDAPTFPIPFLVFDNLGSVRCDRVIRVIVEE